MRKRILTEDDLRNIYSSVDIKADKKYVDDKIKDIDINQFDAIDKGGHSFNTLRDPGVFRLWNSATSPCGTNADYILVVYQHNYNIIQVAYSLTSDNNTKNKVYTRSRYNYTWTSWRELTNTEIENQINKKADKFHTHSANDITETYSRNFVSTAEKLNIRKINDKADKSELDKVKQSGVETNRILVDALNSKNVWASTSSSIRVNARKVNDIKMGDYSIGDILEPKKIEELYFRYDIGSYVESIKIDSNDNVYVGGRNKKVVKLDKYGNKTWEYNADGDVNAIAIDSNNNVYFGGDDKKVTKLNDKSNKIWDYSAGDTVNAIAIDGNNNIYLGGDNKKVTKLNDRGSKIWDYSVDSDVNTIAIDSNNNVYFGADYGTNLTKLDDKGNKIWEYNKASVLAIAIDSNNDIYFSGYNKKVTKLNDRGSKIWDYSVDSGVNAIAIDSNNNVYFGGDDKKVTKLNDRGISIEAYGVGDNINAIAIDRKGGVYAGGVNRAVIGFKPIGYKIIG